jgi:hypothetical protein
MAETEVNNQQLAQQILLAIRGIPPLIAGFTFMPPAEQRRLVLHANLPVRFLNAAAIALDASPALVQVTGLTGEAIRDAVAFRNALQPVSDEIIMIGQGVRHTITSRLSHAGNLAYRVYSMAKTMNRAEDRAVLIPHVESMRRTLARSGRTEPTVEPEPPQPPQPPQTEPPQPPTGPRK